MSQTSSVRGHEQRHNPGNDLDATIQWPETRKAAKNAKRGIQEAFDYVEEYSCPSDDSLDSDFNPKDPNKGYNSRGLWNFKTYTMTGRIRHHRRKKRQQLDAFENQEFSSESETLSPSNSGSEGTDASQTESGSTDNSELASGNDEQEGANEKPEEQIALPPLRVTTPVSRPSKCPPEIDGELRRELPKPEKKVPSAGPPVDFGAQNLEQHPAAPAIAPKAEPNGSQTVVSRMVPTSLQQVKSILKRRNVAPNIQVIFYKAFLTMPNEAEDVLELLRAADEAGEDDREVQEMAVAWAAWYTKKE